MNTTGMDLMTVFIDDVVHYYILSKFRNYNLYYNVTIHATLTAHL